MRKLLQYAQRQHGSTAYLSKLLEEFNWFSTDREETGELKPVEPLTSREIDILRLLDSEISVPEMAGELYISVGTVRTHIKRIYRKLGVHGRYEAVVKGKELHLL